VVDLFGRSLALIEDVAARHDVEVLGAWQPAESVRGDGGAYRDADVGAMVPEAVDLRGALDDQAQTVYLDGVQTEETGAELVARILWPMLRDRLSSSE